MLLLKTHSERQSCIRGLLQKQCYRVSLEASFVFLLCPLLAFSCSLFFLSICPSLRSLVLFHLYVYSVSALCPLRSTMNSFRCGSDLYFLKQRHSPLHIMYNGGVVITNDMVDDGSRWFSITLTGEACYLILRSAVFFNSFRDSLQATLSYWEQLELHKYVAHRMTVGYIMFLFLVGYFLFPYFDLTLFSSLFSCVLTNCFNLFTFLFLFF